MTTTIQKWGNSQAVRLSKSIMTEANLHDNDMIDISVNDDGTITIKKSVKRKTLKELLADYDEEYERIDIDWGKPQGKEIW